MPPFDYYRVDKSKKWETKADIRDNCLLLKVDHHLSPADDASSIRTVLGENKMKDVVPKKGLGQT